jgi:uroporphyrin-III C-methyltransferase/precorrin-2 dehydrogenase/sirohydrochlorin ferrochelatase
MLMSFYPIYLDLHGRNCLVVGGGPIATGKVHGLLDAGACVTVVAPQVSEAIARWHSQGKLKWQQRDFRDADLDQQFLIYAATDDRALNAHVYQLADERRVVANAVDDLDHCNFIAPAVAQAGALQVAVSTSGKSPALAKQLRDRIQHELLTDEAATLAGFLGRWRPEVKQHIDTYQRRQSFWEGVLEGCTPALLAEGDDAGADEVIRECLRRAQAPSNPAATCAAQTGRPDVCRACMGV